MIIKRTPQQEQKVNKILKEIREEYLAAISENSTPEQAAAARTTLLYKTQEALDAIDREEEAKAFKALKGDPEAILNSAREQIPLVIERAEDVYLSITIDADRDTLVENKMFIKKDGKYYIDAAYMMWELRDELRLHLEALKKDQAKIDEISQLIQDAIIKNPYIIADDTSIIDYDKSATETIRQARTRRTSLGVLKTFWLMSTKTANAITLTTSDFLEADADGQLTMKWLVDQSGDSNKAVPTTIYLTTMDKELRGAKKNIKPFDRAVMDTIGSAFKTWEYSHPGEPLHITPTALFRLLKGRQPGDKSCRVSDKQRQDLDASIRKLRATEFSIDISAEVNAKYLKEEGLALLEDSGKLKGFYLTDTLVDVIALGAFDENGRRIPAEYVFSRKPILYTYSEAKGQYLTVDFSVLDVFSDKNVTEYAIEIRNYLITQIENMKNSKGYRRSNKILWDTLYKHAGMKDPQTRVELREEGDRNGENKVDYSNAHSKSNAISKERAKDRAMVESILKAWKQKGYIKGYKIDKLSIEVDPGKPSK